MGKVIMSGIVPQKTAPITFKSNFADNDWSTIIKACQTNKVPDTWTVGSQKTMTIGGTDYAIDIIGKNHDTYSDGSGTAPLTFQMHDCYNTQYVMNSSDTTSGGWTNSAMRTTHLPAILALMPSEVQTGIKEVNKQTCGHQISTLTTTADKLFLLSEYELHNSKKWAQAAEGTQYEYYNAGNSKIKNINGTATTWRLRSPISNGASFCVLTDSGTQTYSPASYSLGVAPAFCF